MIYRLPPPPSHAPLPQHAAWVAGNHPIVGQFHEAVCAPAVDTGLLAQMMEAGDVKALTVGHDHVSPKLNPRAARQHAGRALQSRALTLPPTRPSATTLLN